MSLSFIREHWHRIILLFAFWIIATGRIQGPDLVVGFICVILVANYNRELFFTKKEFPTLNWRRVVIIIRFIAILIVDIFKANIKVASIVLTFRPVLNQGIIKYRCKVEKDVVRVILANAISVTPGTLTIDMLDGYMTVHMLNIDEVDDLVDWNIEKLLVRLEEE